MHLRRLASAVIVAVAIARAGAVTMSAHGMRQDQTPPPASVPPATPPQTTPPPSTPPDPASTSGTPSTAQDPNKDPKKDTGKKGPAGAQDNTTHIFGVLPNYSSVGHGQNVAPLTTKATFAMTAQGAFDKIVFPFTAFTAAVAQWEDQEKTWGQGWSGYGKRYGTSFVDNTMATFMTTAILPTILRQDPRYFVHGEGGVWHRTGYALSRTFITLGRSGHTQFNFSDIFGNGLAAEIMNGYHPIEDRNVPATLNRWGMQILWDGVTNVLKEFWPDIHRHFHKSSGGKSSGG